MHHQVQQRKWVKANLMIITILDTSCAPMLNLNHLPLNGALFHHSQASSAPPVAVINAVAWHPFDYWHSQRKYIPNPISNFPMSSEHTSYQCTCRECLLTWLRHCMVPVFWRSPSLPIQLNLTRFTCHFLFFLFSRFFVCICCLELFLTTSVTFFALPAINTPPFLNPSKLPGYLDGRPINNQRLISYNQDIGEKNKKGKEKKKITNRENNDESKIILGEGQRNLKRHRTGTGCLDTRWLKCEKTDQTRFCYFDQISLIRKTKDTTNKKRCIRPNRGKLLLYWVNSFCILICVSGSIYLLYVTCCDTPCISFFYIVWGSSTRRPFYPSTLILCTAVPSSVLLLSQFPLSLSLSLSCCNSAIILPHSSLKLHNICHTSTHRQSIFALFHPCTQCSISFHSFPKKLKPPNSCCPAAAAHSLGYQYLPYAISPEACFTRYPETETANNQLTPSHCPYTLNPLSSYFNKSSLEFQFELLHQQIIFGISTELLTKPVDGS
ncbi:putative signal peptide protein [Puccinia sorghi]|uniref:Putative signal peptide protein n=1 Tax=Puccinia sorghi TaxID=27349 RepID=A0A0L6V6A7_9BASI|nr:putative signal peptide protein [Puccinia sorghi]